MLFLNMSLKIEENFPTGKGLTSEGTGSLGNGYRQQSMCWLTFLYGNPNLNPS